MSITADRSPDESTNTRLAPAPEALRKPLAEDIAELLLEGGAVTPYAFACYLLRGGGAIASEIARLKATSFDQTNAPAA